MKKSSVIQVVKWEKELIRQYELAVVKQLAFHLFVFVMGYTIGLLFLIN